MKLQTKSLKMVVITVMTVLITMLHYGAMQGDPGLHILHRELYFIPILLASFWFGLRTGLATSIAISLLYAPQGFLYKNALSSSISIGSQILIFNLVGLMLGWLVDRQQREQEKVLANENLVVLGRAATVVGNEMHDLLDALKKLSGKSSRLKCTELD